MEISIRRKLRGTESKYLLKKFNENEYLQTNHNSSLVSSPNGSFIAADHDIESLIINQEVKAKASMLLSVPLTPRISAINNENRKLSNRDSKLSLLHSPRKKITINEATQSFRRRQLNKTKMSNFLQSRRTGSQNYYNIHKKHSFNQKEQGNYQQQQRQQQQQQQQQNKNLNEMQQNYLMKISHKRNQINFFSLSDYFLLAFSKILAKPGRYKIYTLIQQIAIRYQKYPETIAQDVIDMRSIAQKLLLALGSREDYVELKPFEALQVNGELSRLIFHLTHEITTKKYKNYDLIKIYKEIEYCARRLQFHKFTLKICFQFGQIYKQQFDEQNSHAYFAKALKLAIHLNDKFHEQKAIDCFGLAAYMSSKSGQAYYFHQNIYKLNPTEREMIKQKYSNSAEIQKICKDRQILRSKNPQSLLNHNLFDKKKQAFNYTGMQLLNEYEMKNKLKFKQKISEYIQCPIMRSNTLVARGYINKINKIGKIKRYKDWQASRGTAKFKGGEDAEVCSQVMLSHRSLNRRNPEFENKIVQKQRKILLQLISYYTNEKISPLS